MADDKKKVEAAKPKSREETNRSRSFAPPKRGLALAAKDSEWIGMRTDFATNNQTHALFPNVDFSDSTESTTVITKLLVGQKADFSRMPKPHRVFLTKNLSTVIEQPKDDYCDSDVSSLVRTDLQNQSGSDKEYYEDEDEEPKRSTHTKRRKKRSDLKDLPDDVSSISLIPGSVPARRKSGSRMRHADDPRMRSLGPMKHTDGTSWAMSNDADDEYQSQSEDTYVDHRTEEK